jgi:hypothetical protein
MAFLPVNIFLAVLFLFGIVWGWEGEELRQFFGVLSAIFMLPLWTVSLYNISGDPSCCSIFVLNNWLPTALIVNVLWWNVVLMYFTGAHLMQTLGRDEPIGKAFKKMRKQ